MKVVKLVFVAEVSYCANQAVHKRQKQHNAGEHHANFRKHKHKCKWNCCKYYCKNNADKQEHKLRLNFENPTQPADIFDDGKDQVAIATAFHSLCKVVHKLVVCKNNTTKYCPTNKSKTFAVDVDDCHYWVCQRNQATKHVSKTGAFFAKFTKHKQRYKTDNHPPIPCHKNYLLIFWYAHYTTLIAHFQLNLRCCFDGIIVLQCKASQKWKIWRALIPFICIQINICML